MKALLLTGLFSTMAFAQPYIHPMEVKELITKLQIVGKTIVQSCENLPSDQICEAELKKSLKIHENTNVLIIKKDTPLMHEYSHLRIYVQVDENNKIERAGL